MWHSFIQEYQDNQLENADRYPYEVRIRVMLEFLKPELGGQIRIEVAMLQELDSYLKRILIPDKLMREPEIQAGFPIFFIGICLAGYHPYSIIDELVVDEQRKIKGKNIAHSRIVCAME